MDATTVLIVDDDEDSRTICATLLLHRGYRILQAGDGPEALRLARAERPALALLDVSLPSLDGLAVTRMLKTDPATVAIKVVMLTARAFDADRLRGREVGCDGYLIKPCSPRAILEEVLRLIGPAAGAQDAGST